MAQKGKRVNDHIQNSRVQLITEEGENLGIFSRYDALRK